MIFDKVLYGGYAPGSGRTCAQLDATALFLVCILVYSHETQAGETPNLVRLLSVTVRRPGDVLMKTMLRFPQPRIARDRRRTLTSCGRRLLESSRPGPKDMALLLDTATKKSCTFRKCADNISTRFLFEPRVCALQVGYDEIELIRVEGDGPPARVLGSATHGITSC